MIAPYGGHTFNSIMHGPWGRFCSDACQESRLKGVERLKHSIVLSQYALDEEDARTRFSECAWGRWSKCEVNRDGSASPC